MTHLLGCVTGGVADSGNFRRTGKVEISNSCDMPDYAILRAEGFRAIYIDQEIA